MYSWILQAQVLNPLKVTSKGDISSHGGVTQFRYPITKTLTEILGILRSWELCVCCCANRASIRMVRMVPRAIQKAMADFSRTSRVYQNSRYGSPGGQETLRWSCCRNEKQECPQLLPLVSCQMCPLLENTLADNISFVAFGRKPEEE
jgi:hypothetical protein